MDMGYKYYASTCSWCGEDCDGKFCSDRCRVEYEEDRAAEQYSQWRDDQLMEAFN